VSSRLSSLSVAVRPKGGTAERIRGEVAERAHGVVDRVELLATGITQGEIKQRLANGALLREYRGVYRVGHRAPSVEASYLAVVKACGEGAVLSGRAAGHLFGLLRARAAPEPEVTARTAHYIEGIKTRRSRSMDPRDCTRWKRIPVTTVARTLVDLAAVLAFDDLARACHEAGVRYRTTPAEVE